MAINVSEAIDSDTGVPATLFDKNNGGYVDGLYVKPSETTRKALISFQQPTPKQLQFLKDGERTSDMKAMYINKEVFESVSESAVGAGDAKSATETLHRGKRYKVVFAGDWNDYGFMFAIGARI